MYISAFIFNMCIAHRRCACHPAPRESDVHAPRESDVQKPFVYSTTMLTCMGMFMLVYINQCPQCLLKQLAYQAKVEQGHLSINVGIVIVYGC